MGVAYNTTRAAEQAEPAQFQTISAAELSEGLNDKDFVLVNVHIPYEGEIAGTDLFVPYDQIATRLREFPSDKGKAIVLYCRSGRMSEIAAMTLVRLGYSKVSHLANGMNGWTAAGFPLLRR
ncbi:MAG: hypothetical protein BGO83_18180 [Devosia sp. 66-14]|nr:MAG: hypothetical protein ABS47_11200 [Devosia sp. SCN 66-27]OJX23127.1 MAG: hypothetical protein BGO83_18180 [Devosia sp. 66-14]